MIRLDVHWLPSGATAKPVWLWWSTSIDGHPGDPDPHPDMIDRLWQVFLRHFDIEHTFRLVKQMLDWTLPKLRDPDAADRWTWLVIAAYTQLRLAHTVPSICVTLGETGPPAAPHPGPCPPRISSPPREADEAVAQLSIFGCQESLLQFVRD